MQFIVHTSTVLRPALFRDSNSPGSHIDDRRLALADSRNESTTSDPGATVFLAG